MSKKNFNSSIEDGLENVSGGTGFLKKIGNKFKGLFNRKDKLSDKSTNMPESPLLPDNDED